MEVLAPVDFSVEEMKRIVLKTHGAIAWGGGMNLASADDKLIKIRNPLALDPRGMLLASILAKKKSVGAHYVVVDIPLGRGVKIMNMEDAEALGADFIKIGKRLDMTIEGLITDGSEPVGNGIGPGLEVKDVMQVLQGTGPADLRNKSCMLAGKILELVGKVKEGEGYEAAFSLLQNGKAWSKMKEIVGEQGGNANFKESDIPIGHYKHTVRADREGKISHIDNKGISKIARAAGAPKNKGAGIYLYRLKGDRVKPGDLLFDIYAESEAALEYSIKALEVWKPIELEKMLLGTMR
jgi:AMP phosphorylase